MKKKHPEHKYSVTVFTKSRNIKSAVKKKKSLDSICKPVVPKLDSKGKK